MYFFRSIALNVFLDQFFSRVAFILFLLILQSNLFLKIIIHELICFRELFYGIIEFLASIKINII